jgi:hypothetical protein
MKNVFLFIFFFIPVVLKAQGSEKILIKAGKIFDKQALITCTWRLEDEG